MRLEARHWRIVLTLLLAGAAVAWWASPVLTIYFPRPNPLEALSGHAHSVSMTLEEYARVHGGHYPRDVLEANAVFKGAYGSTALPPGPWGGRQQALLPICRELGSVDRPTPKGTALGDGSQVRHIRECRHFGALLYDGDPDGKHFVLYGIGKRGRSAVVAVVVRDGIEE